VRVLLDTCIWGPAANELEAAGHEVEWVGNWDADPGDEKILAAAIEKEAVLVTLDKDFGEMAVVRDIKHSGIIRLVGFSATAQGQACLTVLSRYSKELASGAIVTATEHRIRIRPASPEE
jgi:predicted nuclease of predicted toxin-antitoxin system